MITLQGQVAVIAGGSRGIGAATAVLLAKAGADCVITYRRDRRSALQAAALVERAGRRALIVRAAVEREADARMVVARTLEAMGRIDILVNSAGIWEYGALGRLRLRDWRRTIEVNLDGTFVMTSAVVPEMKRRKYGRIVNVSSTAGQRGEALHSHYAASKGGVIAFTKSAAAELALFGINVNCVAPGWVDTDMVAGVMKKSTEKKEILRSIPRGKVATADEIAGPILFLCSRLADHLLGEVLNANGGSVMCG